MLSISFSLDTNSQSRAKASWTMSSDADLSFRNRLAAKHKGAYYRFIVLANSFGEEFLIPCFAVDFIFI